MISDDALDTQALWRVIARFKQHYPIRAEITHERNLDMSAYMRQHCRPSKRGCRLNHVELGCMVVTDIDFVMWDYNRRIMQIVEVKSRGGKCNYAQSELLEALNLALLHGQSAAGFTYLGTHILRVENSTPLNSKWIEWDGHRITREQCWLKLNMLDAMLSED